MTLQEIADKEGISRQAVWLRTAKGKAHNKAYNQRPEVKAYHKAYNQRPEVKAYQKAYQKAYNQRPEVKAYQKAYMKALYISKIKPKRMAEKIERYKKYIRVHEVAT